MIIFLATLFSRSLILYQFSYFMYVCMYVYNYPWSSRLPIHTLFHMNIITIFSSLLSYTSSSPLFPICLPLFPPYYPTHCSTRSPCHLFSYLLIYVPHWCSYAFFSINISSILFSKILPHTFFHMFHHTFLNPRLHIHPWPFSCMVLYALLHCSNLLR